MFHFRPVTAIVKKLVKNEKCRYIDRYTIPAFQNINGMNVPMGCTIMGPIIVIYYLNTKGSPNLSADRVQTVPNRSVPYRTVPCRFPRGTVLVERTAYCTFLTVFRDFCLKARTVPYQNTDRFSLFQC
jgi:hypothetical protein